MAQDNLPISLPGFQLTGVHQENDRIRIEARSVQGFAFCPNCKTKSTRVHSYDTRVPADLPISEARVQLRLTVRRFRCQGEDCSKSTFVESFPEFVIKYARRTERLGSAMQTIVFALGGRPGSRWAHKLQMPVSGDTLLRIIRKIPQESQPNPAVIGIDDWAKRRGRVYGTIIVYLERRPVIDLRADRTADTLEKWLRTHPSVKIVARDRSLEYARGISKGAPHAAQVADRWHLLVNLREALERILDRLRPDLNALAAARVPTDPAEIPIRRHRRRSPTDDLAKKKALEAWSGSVY